MYFRKGAAAPGGGGHSAARLSVRAAGFVVTFDVLVVGGDLEGGWKSGVPRHRCVSADA